MQNQKKNYGKVRSLYPNREMGKEVLVNQLTDAAWNFAHSTLWHRHQFDNMDKSVCKDSIKLHFLNSSKPIKDAFVEFCERVILAKWYVQKTNSRYIPHPAFWLNGRFEKGFIGTASWYKTVELRRRNNPNHHIGLKTLAINYLEYVLQPNDVNFQIGRNSLIELYEFNLLQHYNNCIINYHYLAA